MDLDDLWGGSGAGRWVVGWSEGVWRGLKIIKIQEKSALEKQEKRQNILIRNKRNTSKYNRITRKIRFADADFWFKRAQEGRMGGKSWKTFKKLSQGVQI